MAVRPRVCSLPGCERDGAGWCPSCQTVYCSRQCQQENWPTHRHICPRPPPMRWFTASTSSTGIGQQPPEILEEENKPLEREARGMDPSQKILVQIQEDLKICQDRLDRFEESSRESSLSPIRPQIKQENPGIPDSPIKSLESPDIIVNPPERQDIPDNSTNPPESSETPTKPLETSSSNNPLSTRESPGNISKNKKKSVSFVKPPENSLATAPQPKMTVKVAQLSRELPGRMVEKKTLYEVLPVEHFQSPSEFSIRLKIEVSL